MTAKKAITALTVIERAKERLCPNCGSAVVRKSRQGPPKKFCDAKCAREFRARAVKEGSAAIPLAKAWRVNRGKGEIAKKAFQQFCTMLDIFNAADREAGRPRADLFAAKLLADGREPIDRLRG